MSSVDAANLGAWDEFATLPEAARREARFWQQAFEEISDETHLRKAFQRIASSLRGRRGCSAANIRNKYYAWLKSGRDLSVLVNHNLCPKKTEYSYEFLDFWRGLCERNQRSCKAAYRALNEMWLHGEEIPSFGSRQGHADLPKGLSYANLMRLKPTRFELTVARRGRSAATTHRPLVFTTRKGLHVGSHYLFDDIWHDHFVNILDLRKAGRPLEFHCVDLFSACKIGWGMKVRTLNEETGSMDSLKEWQMRWLLAKVLHCDGYSADGTSLVVEHGTAAIREDMERLLYDLSDGKITVSRSGMDGAAALADAYAGRSKGNFRFKAALESLGNLIHNAMAALPAQVGRNIDHRPEALHGMLKHNDALLEAMRILEPEQIQQLQFPLLEFNRFLGIAAKIYHSINSRTDHELEGWDENLLEEFRMTPQLPWQSMKTVRELPPAQQDIMAELITTTPELRRVRKLSPLEVWQRDRNHLIKLPAWGVCDLLGRDLAQERKVDRGLFEFVDRELSSNPIRYEAVVANRFNQRDRLKEGETYLTFVNPFDMQKLFVCNAKGGFIGTCNLWTLPTRSDTEAVMRQIGAAAKTESELLTDVRRRSLASGMRRMEMAQNNTDVIRGKKDAAHKLILDRAKKEKGTLDDLMPESQPVTQPAGIQNQEGEDDFSALL